MIKEDIKKIARQPSAAWVLLGIFALCSSFAMEFQLYSSSIRPVIEHAEFITVPGSSLQTEE